jgi:hypothetical protein
LPVACAVSCATLFLGAAMKIPDQRADWTSLYPNSNRHERIASSRPVVSVISHCSERNFRNRFGWVL